MHVSKQIHICVYMYIKVSEFLLGFSAASGTQEGLVWGVLESGSPVG